MTNRRTNLIKGQSERDFEKNYPTSTCFTPRPLHPSIDISNNVGSHDEAKLFFANLRKTCRKSESRGE